MDYIAEKRTVKNEQKSYPAWIRTMNEGTKIPSVAVTPPGIIGEAEENGISLLPDILPSYFFLSPTARGVSPKKDRLMGRY
jgi:hypothetical protein